MKKLKSIICILLCLFVTGVFSACGKKEEPKSKNPNENNPNELTLSQVLSKVYENLDGLTKNQYGETQSFSSKTGTNYTYPIYDKFVYAGIYMLKLLTETEDIKDGVWLQGEESEMDLADGNPSKLEMLYISRKKQNYQNLIDIYMVFHKKSIDFAENPQAYLLYNYNITYDEKSYEITIDCAVENSSKREFQESGSTAIYSNFSYNESLGFKATTFERIIDIDVNAANFEHLINEETIKSYDCIVFDFKHNDKIFPTSISDLNVSRGDSKTNIKTLLENFNQIELKTFNLDVEKKVVSGLTDKFLAVAGANHISDFIK